MPCIYIYDGTFEGLLDAIHRIREREEAPEGILPGKKPVQVSLFSKAKKVTPDHSRAETLAFKIEKEISRRAFLHVYHSFLSESEGIEMSIFHYLDLGFTLGKEVHSHLADQRVFTIHQFSRRVRREKNRMLGLIRFQKVHDGYWYAVIRPAFNVLSLVAPYFTRRLPDQSWVIHDPERGLAAFYHQGRLALRSLASKKLPIPMEEENYYHEMWWDYFQTITISERLNPGLQRRCMPLRYWQMLTEMRGPTVGCQEGRGRSLSSSPFTE
jgi:probable DNA metabolism protein